MLLYIPNHGGYMVWEEGGCRDAGVGRMVVVDGRYFLRIQVITYI
jgi:hypothetical protein